MPTERPVEVGVATPAYPYRAPAQTGPAEVPTAEVPTELRVHGVSGAPAQEMLDRPLVTRVAGDDEAGFFRPRPEYPSSTLGPGGARLEAYRWGKLTAGAAARAFWLLLLPFTLANLPMWLRPPAVGLGRRSVNSLCRVFALTISGTFTLTAVGICLDLAAWQCAIPGGQCAARSPWLEGLFSGFFEPTGRRLALAMLGPLLLIALLWLLAVRSWARYERIEPRRHQPDGDGLSNPAFWNGRAQVGRLRSVHIAAMLATVDASTLFVIFGHDRRQDAFAGVWLGGVQPSTVVQVGAILFWTSIGILALSVLLVLLPPVADRSSQSRPAMVATRLLRTIAMLLTVASAAYALLPRAPWIADGPLPGYAGTVTKLFALQVVIIALLGLIVLFQRHRCRGGFLGGFGAPVVASVGLGLAAAFSAGASYRVADYFNGDAVPSPAHFGAAPQLQPLQPPVQLQWAAIGFALVVLVALIAAVWISAVTRPLLVRRARRETDEDYPGGRERDPRRAASIDAAIANARLTESVIRIFGLAWVFAAAGGLAATGLALADIGPVQLAASGSAAAEALSFFTNAGTYLVSLFIVLLVLLGVQTYRNARVRRTVGVIWDLATFWPRAAHPLAPPCYAERAVPELVHRATWLATERGGLVLSGHSQGSVLVAATVLQLPLAAKQRTALLTYGSPLARFYQRAFPTYFGATALTSLALSVAKAGQPRWINLWRGGAPPPGGGGGGGAALGVGDRRLADPVAFDPLPGHRLPPPIEAHSDYQLTAPFAQAVEDLVGLLAAHTPARVSN